LLVGKITIGLCMIYLTIATIFYLLVLTLAIFHTNVIFAFIDYNKILFEQYVISIY